jgi:hypothetical protein
LGKDIKASWAVSTNKGIYTWVFLNGVGWGGGSGGLNPPLSYFSDPADFWSFSRNIEYYSIDLILEGPDGTETHAFPVPSANEGWTHYTFEEIIWTNKSKVSGYVFEDKNTNGVRDENISEKTLPGWTIELAQQEDLGPLSETTCTDANGYFEFTNVTEGSYSISIVQNSGWKSSTPQTQPVSISSESGDYRVDFGMYRQNEWPYSQLKKGDILIMRGGDKTIVSLLHLLADVYWTHCALYFGEIDGLHYIIEADYRNGNPVMRSLQNRGLEEEWALLRVNTTDEARGKSVGYAYNNLMSSPYPFSEYKDFPLLTIEQILTDRIAVRQALNKNTSRTLYCSSLVWQAWFRSSDGKINLDSNFINNQKFHWTDELNIGCKAYVFPDDIWFMGKIPSPVSIIDCSSDN